MEIKGTLKTMPLGDLIRWLSDAGQTGTLVFQIGWIRKKLFFKDGHIISASSSDPREFLGQFLLRKGWISEGQLIKAIEQQLKNGRMIGSIMVEKGWLTKEQLRQALQEKAQDTIYSLFLAEDGTFEFHDGELPVYEMIPIDIPVEAILLEGALRRDNWNRIQQTFPAEGRTILKRKEGKSLPKEMRDDWSLYRIYRTLDGKKSLNEIALLLYETDYHVFYAALELYQAGLVEIAGELPADETEPAKLPLELLVQACQSKLRENQIHEALHMVSFIESHYTELSSEVLKLQTVVYQKLIENLKKEIPAEAVPCLKRDMNEIMELRLDPMQGFMLARINGTYDVKTLKTLVPVPEEKFYMMLQQLLDMDLIELRT